MGYDERKGIIEKIEKLRESKVITYVITTRTGIPILSNVMMEETDLREIYRHFEKDSAQYEKLDLFIYSLGGDASIAWPLVNLIREYYVKFSVMIPYYAFSCATSVAIGANEIIMCKTGILGPIDPKVGNDFNPTNDDGGMLPISVEDINGFNLLIKDKFGIKDEACLTELHKIFASKVHPLALGNAYRHYLKARDDATKLLELHMDPIKDKRKIEKIVKMLVEKLYYHGHHITRNEAKLIKLDVVDAEKIKNDTGSLDDLIWKLYLEYEKELMFDKPFRDHLPPRGKKNVIIPVKYIESSKHSSEHVIEQEWFDFGFPKGSKFSFSPDGRNAVYNPKTKETIPIFFEGIPMIFNDKIYLKREQNYWKSSNT
jgi:hypothetical protein